MLHFSIAVGFSFLITSARALNDWSVPCFGGECSYDLPVTSQSSGSVKIVSHLPRLHFTSFNLGVAKWGSPDAITDITKAAGWVILGCDANAMTQDIRLVCSSDDTATSGCGHLYQNGGAVGKIVRLPENVCSTLFFRVVPRQLTLLCSAERCRLHALRKPGWTKTNRFPAMLRDRSFEELELPKSGLFPLTRTLLPLILKRRRRTNHRLKDNKPII